MTSISTDHPSFADLFSALTGHEPFPWQEKLYKRFVSDDGNHIPKSCSIPTGLGKTNVIAVWLIALANHPGKMPRRLVYVVNRRTVVDQTTEEVVRFRENAPKIGIDDLAVSTLRGQFADNREWSADPSRPAVICGTVDMIGSKLLFSGYGCGFKSKPLHAGFLGQDVLLVHDEAHLEPAFQTLIKTIEKEQERCQDFGTFRVMQLTATTRGQESGDGADNRNLCGLTDEERNPPDSIPDDPTEPIHHVWKRLRARKSLFLHPIKDEKKELADELATEAMDHQGAILVFATRVKDVEDIVRKLPEDSCKQLTGTLRGLERDQLVKTPIFQRFLPESSRDSDVEKIEGTVYLVCTSAGEVGVDISADHMVCDLSTFDSMIQRFGRVNRYGKCPDTKIHVVHPHADSFDDKKPNPQRKATLALLKRLPSKRLPSDDQVVYDASPKSLSDLMVSISEQERINAFAPEPTILPATDILFDAWSMTTIREKMPGRPPVAPYLHGIADDLPQTTLAWRAELDLVSDDPTPQKKLQSIFNKHRIRPHETITTAIYHVIKFFKDLAKKHPKLRQTRVAVMFSHDLKMISIDDLLDQPGLLNSDPTIILPATFGGLDSNGMLSVKDVTSEPLPKDNSPRLSLDIADNPGYELTPKLPPRLRVLIERTERGWKAESMPGGKPLQENIETEKDYDRSTMLVNELSRKTGLRVRLVQALKKNDEGEDIKSLVVLTPSLDRKPLEGQLLVEHVNAVEREAERIVCSLELQEPFRSTLLFAAKWHDEGKKSPIWQRFIGGNDPEAPLGKSAECRNGRLLCGYRHEFGSLLRIEHPDVLQTPCSLPDDLDQKDLALHLIAAHHGFARPHFKNTIDHDFNSEQSDKTHTEVIRRFARLQRKHGRWGLAYLESLLRAADAAASGENDYEDDDDDIDGDEE